MKNVSKQVDMVKEIQVENKVLFINFSRQWVNVLRMEGNMKVPMFYAKFDDPDNLKDKFLGQAPELLPYLPKQVVA